MDTLAFPAGPGSVATPEQPGLQASTVLLDTPVFPVQQDLRDSPVTPASQAYSLAFPASVHGRAPPVRLDFPGSADSPGSRASAESELQVSAERKANRDTPGSPVHSQDFQDSLHGRVTQGFRGLAASLDFPAGRVEQKAAAPDTAVRADDPATLAP